MKTNFNGFYKGMPRSEVGRLLGAPDYSPIDGQYYYSSDRSVDSEDKGRSVTVGLVVDYRDAIGNVTDTLHEFRLGPKEHLINSGSSTWRDEMARIKAKGA